MNFISFKNDNNLTYSYHQRGLEAPYFPDLEGEKEKLLLYNSSNGNLFKGEHVAWKGEVLLNMAVDICVSFGSEIFVDTIYINQIEDSAFSLAEVFDKTSDEVRKIGEFKYSDNVQSFLIPIGVKSSSLIIRINGSYRNFGIKSLDITGVSDIDDAIYPTPAKCDLSDGSFSLNNAKIRFDTEEAKYGAEYFSLKLKEKQNVDINFSQKEGKITFVKTSAFDDGFEINITEDECIVISGTKLGFLYASDVLLKLSDGKAFKCVHIEDKPFMDFRGVHLALPERKNISFFKKLIKELIIPMRYNAVFLQFSGAMQYESFPEISKNWEKSCHEYEKGNVLRPAHYEFVGHDSLTKDEVRDLCNYIKAFGLELIPEIQSWGHTQYITSVFPELSEEENTENVGDIYNADARLKTGSAHCMCPSHKDYYNITFKIIDEVLEVSKPQHYVHMGHDEIYDIGICNKCKEKGAARLYTEEVTALNNYIKKKGYTMMLWADMLQEEKFKTRLAIDKVPEDIIFLDFTWYFHPEKDIEDKLIKHGFDVVFGNMYSSHFPRWETRSRKNNIMGAEVSTWVYCDEKTLSYEGKMYELIYSANMLWNSQYNSKLRLSYSEIIKPLIWEIRKKLGNISYNSSSSIDFKKTLYDANINKNYAECSLNNETFEVSLNCNAKYISLLWASDKNAPRVMWEEPFSMGEVILELSDGTFVKEDISYALNIFTSSSRYGTPIPSYLFRHEGYIGTYYTKPHCLKTKNGDDYTLDQHFIKIPEGKKIKKIKLNHKKNTDAKIMIYDINYHV